MALLLASVVMGLRASSFEVIDGSFGGAAIRSRILRNTLTGESAEVIFAPGARLESLELRPRGKPAGPLRSVLVSHHGNATAVLANANWKGQMLAPFANRIRHGRYEFGGVTYQLPINEHNITYPNGHTQVCGIGGFVG